MRKSLALFLLGCTAVAEGAWGQATTMTFTDESIFAVVTHRGGLAGGLAHNHFIVAREFLADFNFDAGDPTQSTLRFSTLSEDLVVDDPELAVAWIPRLRELQLVDELADLDEGDRAKVRSEMLDDDQLDPVNYPVIGATITAIAPASTEIGAVSFDHVATLDVTVHGTTVSRDVAIRYEEDGDRLRIEGVGRFQFEEFGIEPYSAFLGTVKNQNDFEIYVNLVAVPAATTGGP